MLKCFLISLFFSASVFAKSVKIVALGDSVTSGYGVAAQHSWPALLEKKLQNKNPEIKVINAGIAGATTASAMANLNWQFKQKFDILILCLGGNDGLRGLKLENSEQNLAKAIELAQSKGIKVLLVGMKIPKNYGDEYRQKFESMYPKLAKKYKVSYMPFLLEGVGAEKELNLPDGIHPNEKGYEKIADNILPYIEKLL